MLKTLSAYVRRDRPVLHTILTVSLEAVDKKIIITLAPLAGATLRTAGRDVRRVFTYMMSCLEGVYIYSSVYTVCLLKHIDKWGSTSIQKFRWGDK